MTDAQLTELGDHRDYENSAEHIAGTPPAADQRYTAAEWNRMRGTVDQHAPLIDSNTQRLSAVIAGTTGETLATLRSAISTKENSGVAANLNSILEAAIRGGASTDTLSTLRADISALTQLLSSNDATLDSAQERVDRIKQLILDVETLDIADIDGLQDALNAASIKSDWEAAEASPTGILNKPAFDLYIGMLDPASDTLPAANSGNYFIAKNYGDMSGLTVCKNFAYRCNTNNSATGVSANWVRYPQHDKGEFADVVAPQEFGSAVGHGGDDHAALYLMCQSSNNVKIPSGDYRIGSSRLGEFQKPLNITGTGPDSVIRVMKSNVDSTAFRVGAVGGAFYRTRAVTKFESLVFTGESDIASTTDLANPWSYTGIDAQSTHPLVMKDLVFLNMGPDALKILSCFYGYMDGYSFVNSGINLHEVNVMEFSGGDVRIERTAVDASGGSALFGSQDKYPVQMLQSDNIKFTGTVFEGWQCPVFNIVRSDDTVFNGCWFETLESDAHVMRLSQSDTVEFNSCQLDFRFAYTDSFIHVDNSGPIDDRRKRMTTFIRINGGNLGLASVANGPREDFITTENDEPVCVLVDGVQFAGGLMYASRSVDFDVKSIFLSRALNVGFYSLPNASLIRDNNSFMEGSVNPDWDFQLGADMAQVGGAGELTVSTTTADEEFMTGTTGVKVAGIPADGAAYDFARSSITEMGKIINQGDVYFVYARVKSDQDVDLNLHINGGFANLGFNKPIRLRAGVWRDVVFKTAEDVSWAQGRFFNPQVRFTVTNNSGTASNFFIDRLDYKIAEGDVYLSA